MITTIKDNNIKYEPLYPILNGELVDTLTVDGKKVYDRLDIESDMMKEYLRRMESFEVGDTDLVDLTSIAKKSSKVLGYSDSFVYGTTASHGGVAGYSWDADSESMSEWADCVPSKYKWGGKAIPVLTGTGASYINFYSDLAKTDLLFQYPSTDNVTLVRNLAPGKTYYYKVVTSTGALVGSLVGSIAPQGRIRLLVGENTWNIRDCGGMNTTDGKKFKFNKLIRGGAPDCYYTTKKSDGTYTLTNLVATKNDIALLLKGLCNVGVLVDLRAAKTSTSTNTGDNNYHQIAIVGNDTPHTVTLSATGAANYSALGVHSAEGNPRYYCNSSSFEQYTLNSINRTILIQSLNRAIPYMEGADNLGIYVHCKGGKDRTGTYCYLLMALCDVTERDLLTMYEAHCVGGIADLKAKTDATEKCTATTVPTSVELIMTSSTYADLRKCIAFGVYNQLRRTYKKNGSVQPIQEAAKAWFSEGYDPTVANKHIVHYDGTPIQTAEKAIEYIKYLFVEGATYTDANKYTVTVTTADATLGTVSGGGTDRNGATVTITAQPADGFKFVRWSDGNTSANRSVTVGTSNVTYEAIFAVDEITFTYGTPDLVNGTNTMSITSQLPPYDLTYSILSNSILSDPQTREELHVTVDPSTGAATIYSNTLVDVSQSGWLDVTATYKDGTSDTLEVWFPCYRFSTPAGSEAPLTWNAGTYSRNTGNELNITSSSDYNTTGGHTQAFDVRPGDEVIVEVLNGPQADEVSDMLVTFYNKTSAIVDASSWAAGSTSVPYITSVYSSPDTNDDRRGAFYFRVPENTDIKSLVVTNYGIARTTLTNWNFVIYIKHNSEVPLSEIDIYNSQGALEFLNGIYDSVMTDELGNALTSDNLVVETK